MALKTSPWAKSSLLPVLTHKLYWNPAIAHYSQVICGCFWPQGKVEWLWQGTAHKAFSLYHLGLK